MESSMKKEKPHVWGFRERKFPPIALEADSSPLKLFKG
jgi:hypothetical protein